MNTKITENQFKNAAKALLPLYIKLNGLPYQLDVGGLLDGGYRISYCNGNLSSDKRMVLDDIWDDPLDCIKSAMHKVRERLFCYEIDERKFEVMNRIIKRSDLNDEVQIEIK